MPGTITNPEAPSFLVYIDLHATDFPIIPVRPFTLQNCSRRRAYAVGRERAEEARRELGADRYTVRVVS